MKLKPSHSLSLTHTLSLSLLLSLSLSLSHFHSLTLSLYFSQARRGKTINYIFYGAAAKSELKTMKK